MVLEMDILVMMFVLAMSSEEVLAKAPCCELDFKRMLYFLKSKQQPLSL